VENELTDFLRYCRLERRLAETTCKAHERDVRACLAFFRERGIAELAAVRPPELRAFLAAEAERRPAVSNQTRTVAALKVFFRFCVENEYLDRDPALVLCTPKKREALPDMLDRRELLGLDWNDVDLERRLLKVRKAKGGRQRVIPIHPALEPLFVDYLRFRARGPEPPLFIGVQGKRLSPTIMVRTFLQYARAAGVTERKHVTPHTLRHVFASELLRAGASLRQIQELLSPKHLDSTQR
jgi:integrase/recombinase XerC